MTLSFLTGKTTEEMWKFGEPEMLTVEKEEEKPEREAKVGVIRKALLSKLQHGRM